MTAVKTNDFIYVMTNEGRLQNNVIYIFIVKSKYKPAMKCTFLHCYIYYALYDVLHCVLAENVILKAVHNYRYLKLKTLMKLFYKQELFLSNSGIHLINEEMNDISNTEKAYIHKDVAENIIID